MCVIAVKRFVTHSCVMSANDPHFRLRLPVELKSNIEQIAKETSRSINAVIVDALEEKFAKNGRQTVKAELQALRSDLDRVQGLVEAVSAHLKHLVTAGR